VLEEYHIKTKIFSVLHVNLYANSLKMHCFGIFSR